VQFVGYETGTDDPPAALLADDGAVERHTLEPGRELSFTLEERHCAGVLDGDSHRACDRAGAPYCDRHTDRWPCARCRGQCSLPLESCREEHVVYLAAFAPETFKVGVTRSWRLRRRLREQGADRGAHLRTVADGRVARETEAEIAVDVGDSVRVRTKTGGLHREVDEQAWGDLLSAYDPVRTFRFDYGLDLRDRPVTETLFSGTVRGVKGRLLVLDNGASTFAVDLRDLVGYEVSEGRPDRDLQSSLGAFG
jgi:hypothetical protein